MKRFKFTLLELVVVIALIGILATLLLPSLRQSRLKSMQAVCMSNLKQQTTAVYIYTQAGDGRMPYYVDGQGSAGNYWKRHLHDAMNLPVEGPYWWSFTNPALECPNDQSESGGGYAYNVKYLGGWLKEFNVAHEVPFITQVSIPTETIMTYDGPDIHAGTGNSWLGYFGVPPSHGDGVIGERHFNGINSSWVDGHISYDKRNFFLAGKNGDKEYYWQDNK